jgi:hypothetical protein
MGPLMESRPSEGLAGGLRQPRLVCALAGALAIGLFNWCWKVTAAIAIAPMLRLMLKELALVHYPALAFGAFGPDIDASKIVWAQDMGTAKNQELLDYYRGRKIWLLQPDIDPLAIVPYGAL